ncbi:hypothetical protein BJ912DRAFT_919929 [Pholiota molesta]|nr:hypothetical protein BJ912DRAFT_919929 [Pholiota molesta]
MSRSNFSDLSCINTSPSNNANIPQPQNYLLLAHNKLKKSISNPMALVSFPTRLSNVDWPMAISRLFVAFLNGKGFRFPPEIADLFIKAKKMVDEPDLRYSDTVVFANEWILNPLDSERAMLYILCLLICKVFEWIDRYEWRTSVPLERYASYIFRKEVGIRMGIPEMINSDTFEECEQFFKVSVHPEFN